MLMLAAVDGLHYLFMIPLSLLSIFLVLVILVQRGRGGGLTGALGGMGGQSAFGTKAGDLFTRITIGVAALWVVLSMLSLKMLNHRSATAGLPTTHTAAPVLPGPAKDGKETPSKEPTTGDKTGDSNPSSETPAPPSKEAPAGGGTTEPSGPPAAAPPSGEASPPPASGAADSPAKAGDTTKP